MSRRGNREHLALALALALVAAVGMAWSAGYRSVATALAHLRWEWVATAVAAQLFALLAYVPSYRVLGAIEGGTRLRWATALKLAGFGAFVPAGGFVYDRRAQELRRDARLWRR